MKNDTHSNMETTNLSPERLEARELYRQRIMAIIAALAVADNKELTQ